MLFKKSAYIVSFLSIILVYSESTQDIDHTINDADVQKINEQTTTIYPLKSCISIDAELQKTLDHVFLDNDLTQWEIAKNLIFKKHRKNKYKVYEAILIWAIKNNFPILARVLEHTPLHIFRARSHYTHYVGQHLLQEAINNNNEPVIHMLMSILPDKAFTTSIYNDTGIFEYAIENHNYYATRLLKEKMEVLNKTSKPKALYYSLGIVTGIAITCCAIPLIIIAYGEEIGKAFALLLKYY